MTELIKKIAAAAAVDYRFDCGKSTYARVLVTSPDVVTELEAELGYDIRSVAIDAECVEGRYHGSLLIDGHASVTLGAEVDNALGREVMKNLNSMPSAYLTPSYSVE